MRVLPLLLLAAAPGVLLAAIVAVRHPGSLSLLEWIVFAAALVFVAVVVTIGTERGVVAPVTRLKSAVACWTRHGSFPTIGRDDDPTEITELIRAFDNAIRTLDTREMELRRALEAQDLAMREIHHRVKNNLQIVASLLNLQASRLRLPEARAEFQSARDRVRALATLHRHLYAEGGLHSITMRSFIHELCEQLFTAFGQPSDGRINLLIEADDLQMSSDQAVPLSLIVTEAVSNAIKYAFPGGRPGTVSVRLSADAELARLVIEDDGIGIPAGGGDSETGPRDGLGRPLIRGFARQLGAALTVDDRAGAGTRYMVELRLRRDRDEAVGEEAHADITA